ncbi:hypothetical protein J5N97_017924 [Dioscorea zingiberensis]|uniref:Uncharacterized protein n=1 Tax=Dioscorea zingiberensis TaxID=325984 RepID=A0A9D5CMW8_9LILI|nr:hypothetical protein J5N97_017924 [Dioscorea zingiberensis]
MLEEMNSRISTDMENLNNKLDAKFKAFEKKIEELIKFEDMTDDTVDASTAHDVDLLKTLESLKCEVSGFKDHIQWLVQIHKNGFAYEVENSEISAEIERLKLGHDGLSRTVQVRVLERKKQANIDLQRAATAFLQCDLEAMDGKIKRLEDKMQNLFVAHKSAYTHYLKGYEEKIIRLDNRRFILNGRAEATKERFKLEKNSASQIESDIQGLIKQIAFESKALKKKLVEDKKSLKEENLS